MLTIVSIQSVLSLMTISPSLNKQFEALVNLAVVTNIIPYILSMAALGVMQKQLNVPVSQAKVANVMAFIGAMYSFYALYSSGEPRSCSARLPPSSVGCCTVPSLAHSSIHP